MKKISTLFHIFSFVLFLIGTISLGIVIKGKFSEYQTQYKSGANIVYKSSDILGISSDHATVTVDFSKQLATGSPLIFGGAHAPFPEHADAWDKIVQAGVTSIRKDFLMEYFFFPDTTLEGYKTNKNWIQDIERWNTKNIQSREVFFNKAKEKNLATIGIIDYVPAWLSHSGTSFGVPKDWDVYKDIVKKSYRYFRSKLDYVEIWNEPDHPTFLNLKNSGMTKEQAYTNIYYYAATAVREVDAEINDGKKTPILGPTLSNVKNNTILQTLLTDSRTKDLVDVVSYHYYGAVEDALPIVKNTFIKLNRPELPIFVTEWSFATNIGRPSPNTNTYLEIPFTSNRLIFYLKNGVQAANYHVLEPANMKNSNILAEKYAFYLWQKNNTAELLPQAKTWKLLSKTLGLGAGPSKIYQSTQASLSGSLGFVNTNNIHGITLVNDESTPKEVTVNLSGTSLRGFVYARAYVASQTYDGTVVIGRSRISGGSTMIFKVALPAQSVVGITLTNDASIEEKVKSIIF